VEHGWHSKPHNKDWVNLSFVDGLNVALLQLQGGTATNEAEVPPAVPSTPQVPSGYARRRKPQVPQLFITLDGKLALGVASFKLNKEKKDS
jgi:hypothetical protein